MFFSHILQGASGLPLGSGGKALCLISGGFDSVVAAYLMMRRGIDMDFLFCNLAGKAYERSVINVTRFFYEKFCHGSHGKMYIVDYSDIVEDIKKSVRPAYAQVILKRIFYRTGEKLAKELECQALITGEAVAQVSSQTLTNLVAIESCIEMPVLRPLVGFDKSDIIKYARQIGTFDLCASIQEYCQLVPDRPVTAAPMAKADEEEAKANLKLIDVALETKEKLHLGKITDADLNTSYLYIDNIPDDSVVIDIRSEEEYEEWHHPDSKNIEWCELLKGYAKLEKSASYVLYCPHGLQSVVIAEKMQSAGYESYSLRGGTRSLLGSSPDISQ
jgi:thiamine biosynthesis protein ThiI